MAIGKDDLSAKAKKGYGFHYNKPEAAFAEWEAELKFDLEQRGLEYNRERLASIDTRREKLNELSRLMADATDEQIEKAIIEMR